MSNCKSYLGDSVYADVSEHGEIVLTTENGAVTEPSNIISIDPAVFRALIGYAKRVKDFGVMGFDL